MFLEHPANAVEGGFGASKLVSKPGVVKNCILNGNCKFALTFGTLPRNRSSIAATILLGEKLEHRKATSNSYHCSHLEGSNSRNPFRDICCICLKEVPDLFQFNCTNKIEAGSNVCAIFT
jgi:hypothetical protein